MEIVLSGGACGGEVVAVSADAESYGFRDADGALWVYRVDIDARVGLLVETALAD